MSGKVIIWSAKERQVQAEALHASIAEQVQQLAESGQWRAFLEFARSFHNYSTGRVGVFEPRECSALAQLWRSAA